MNARGCLPGIILGATVLFRLTAAVASPSGTNLPASAGELLVPDMTALRAMAASRWPSAMDRSARLSLFARIDALTVENVRILKASGGRTGTAANASDWSKARFGQNGIRAAERAIIAGILLQVDILDAALMARDPVRAGKARVARTMRPLRREQDRVFGDEHDPVFFFCVDVLRDIAVLQADLQGAASDDWQAPSRISGQKGAETYLLDSLARLVERAKLLP